MSDKTFYVTTPIYYVNARPHIGHAYTTIVADVLARRHRLLGDDTFFLTGTDEHGQKIERSAAAAGIPPQQFADQVSKSFEDLWKRMGITNNDYIRTTSEKHKRGVQKLFSTLYERGFIYLASYTGSYCVSDEAFVDAPVGTPCPDCGRILEEVTEENFFFKLSEFQKSLIDLIESDTIAITPEARKNEVLSFLRGDVNGITEEFRSVVFPAGVNSVSGHFEGMKQEAIDAGRLAESTSGTLYTPGALKDLSISRSSFTWGIPVPSEIHGKEKTAQSHVIYVWLDALANYITALGYGSDDETLFKKFWPANLHLVGKEIIRFHCVYWPAFLMALNPKLQHKSDEKSPVLPPEEHRAWSEQWVPKAVTAHGWLLFDDSKMSKSKGNIVRTETILDGFGDEVYGKQFPESSKAERDLFASDLLRYFLLREVPFGQDGSFSFDALITRYNADLANGYGNLVSRVLSMIQQYRGGIVPEVPEHHLGSEHESHVFFHDVFFGRLVGQSDVVGPPDGIDALSTSHGETFGALTGMYLQESKFSQSLSLVAWAIKRTDQLLSEFAPWKVAKDANAASAYRLSGILLAAARSIRLLTGVLYPFIPYATAKVWAQLGLGDIETAARNGKLNNLEWGGLKPGTKLGPLGPIFPRADKGLAQIMSDMENPTPIDKEPTDPAAVPPPATTDPAAPPRTTTLDPVPVLPVGGSTALTSGPRDTPSHTEANASGIFAQQPPAPLATENGEQATPQITIDDFAKVELRVAQILVAERIPKADKLLRLEVDLGEFGKRQILSGIAEWYAPEDLIGRRIVVITNLAPRKMRGLESHGMLLAASEEGGKPFLATVPEGAPVGTRLK